MKLIIATATAILLLCAAAAGSPQSLADLAKKEKERRERVKAESKVITNKDTIKYKNGSVTTSSLPPTASPDKVGAKPGTGGDAAPGQTKANPDEPVDFQGRPESFWRQTFTDARQKVHELEIESKTLVLKFNDLQNQFYREADGFKQQQLQREIQKCFYEQDLNKENLAKAQAQLDDLEKEAKKSGVLPGWITSKNP